MIRTALYVSLATTLKLSPHDSADRTIPIERYPTRDIVGKIDDSVTLPPGIYLIRSTARVEVLGDHVQAEVSINNKDEWPDPPWPAIATLSPSVDRESLREFFRVTKSADGPAV